jgi:hypothetical protein
LLEKGLYSPFFGFGQYRIMSISTCFRGQNRLAVFKGVG